MSPPTPPARFLLLAAALALLLLSSLTLAASDAAAEPYAAAAVSDGANEVALCPVRCFRPDSVCGADRVTYWCGYPEAACASATVARRGYCKVAAGSSSSAPPSSSASSDAPLPPFPVI